MKLSDWLSREGITQSEFARRIERDPATVTKIIKGHVRPDWTTLERIQRETGGDVLPNDFFGIDAPTPEGPAPGGAKGTKTQLTPNLSLSASQKSSGCSNARSESLKIEAAE